MVLGMLRGHFQTAGGMVQDQFLQVRLRAVVDKAVLGQEKVVSDAAADVGVPDAFGAVDPVVQLQQPRMVAIQVRATGREQARTPLALRADVLVDCAVYYTADMAAPVPEENRETDL